MRTIAIGTFIAFALAGCDGKETGGTGTSTTSSTTTNPTTTTGGTATGTVTIGVSWNDDGEVPTDTGTDGLPDVGCGDSVDITISDPLGMTAWDFGMAEAGANGWTGEDCLNGYAGFNFCHAIGVSHTLDEVTDCAISSIVEGSSTLMDAAKDPFLTYFADDGTTCFVFGNDTAYYASLSCVEMM